MLIQFTLQEFLIFLLCILGIASGAVLLPILWNMKKVVGILRPLVEDSKDFLKKAGKKMPEVFEDATEIGSNVRYVTGTLKATLPDILQEVEIVTNTAKESIARAGDVMEKMGSGINDTVSAYKKDSNGYFHVFEELMQLVYRTLTAK